LTSAVGDCLPVHRAKNKVEDSATYYRIPVTASVRDSVANEFGEFRNSRGGFTNAFLRIEAVSANGVVLATDSVLYTVWQSSDHRQVSGSLDLTPEELSHTAKVRVRLSAK
jgi:hypothetical protein